MGDRLRGVGRWVVGVATAALIVGSAVGLLGRAHRRPVPLPPELGGGPEWIEPAWAMVPMAIATGAVPVLLWGLSAQWVGRVLRDQAADTAAPRSLQWVAGFALSTLLAAAAQFVLSILAVLSWDWDDHSDQAWNPLLAQAAFLAWAPLTGGAALLVVTAAGITWGLVTPSAPPPAHGRRPLS